MSLGVNDPRDSFTASMDTILPLEPPPGTPFVAERLKRSLWLAPSTVIVLKRLYAPPPLAAPVAGNTTWGDNLSWSTKARLKVGLQRTKQSEVWGPTPWRVGEKSGVTAPPTGTRAGS